MKHADHSLGVLHHLKALLEILGPEQLEMEQPQVVSSVESSGGDYFSFINVQIVSINYVNSCRLLYLNGVVSDPDAMECVTHIADLATKAPHVRTYVAQCLSVVYIVLNIQCPGSLVCRATPYHEDHHGFESHPGQFFSFSLGCSFCFA